MEPCVSTCAGVGVGAGAASQCLLLHGGVLGSAASTYVAVQGAAPVADSELAEPTGLVDGPEPRIACSASDNTSCDNTCRSQGWSSGYCCCSCGDVALCRCRR